MKAIQNLAKSLINVLKLLINGRYLSFFIPGIVIAIAYFFVINVLSSWFSFLGNAGAVPWVGDKLESGVSFISKWGNNIAYFIFQFIILTLFSPFNAILGEKIDKELTGKEIKGGLERLLTDIVRMIGILLIGLIFDFVFFLLWNITIGNLFDVSTITPFIMLLLSSFWFGFSFYDFALERDQVSIGDSYRFAFKNMFEIILTGLLFTALMLIPYIGIVIAPVMLTMLTTFNYYKMKNVNSNLTKNQIEIS